VDRERKKKRRRRKRRKKRSEDRKLTQDTHKQKERRHVKCFFFCYLANYSPLKLKDCFLVSSSSSCGRGALYLFLLIKTEMI